MKLSFYRKLLGLITLPILFSFGASVNADVNSGCSLLSVDMSNEYYIKLEKINGDILFSGVGSFSRLEKTSQFKLPPGIYEILGSIQSKNKKLESDKLVYFALQLKQLQQVSLIIKEKNGEPVDVIVEEQPITDCAGFDGLNVSEFLSSNPSVTPLPISAREQKVIQHIFSQIAAEKGIRSSFVSGVMPGGLRADIGIRFDRFVGDTEGIKILSVTPNSNAHSMGVVSGDRIIAINGLLLQGSYEEQTELFYSKIKSDKSHTITLSFIRNEKPITIEGKIEPIYIPRYSFEINEANNEHGVYKYTPISASGSYQLDKKIISLMNKYKAQFANAGNLLIDIPAQVDNSLGVSGVRESKGIRINFVGMQSVAEQLGLQKSDLLVSVNGKVLNSPEVKLTFEEGVQKLQAVVYRNGIKMELSNYVEIKPLPKLKFIINTQMQDTLIAQRRAEEKAIDRLDDYQTFAVPKTRRYLNRLTKQDFMLLERVKRLEKASEKKYN